MTEKVNNVSDLILLDDIQKYKYYFYKIEEKFDIEKKSFLH